MVRQNLCVADIAKVNLVHLLDVVKMDEQQNLGELNLDEVLTFLNVAHRLRCFPVDVQVDAEQRHLLRTDYFLDVVDAEQRYLLNHLLNHLLKRDYFLDVEQA
jgi:hypothetical protein